MARYCTKCRKELSETAKFCSGCGAKIEEVKPIEQPSVQPTVEPERVKDARRKKGFVPVTAFVLVLAIVILLFVWPGFSVKEETVGLTFKATEAQRIAELAGAMATEQYIYARLKTDQLSEYDIKKGSTIEYKKLLSEVLKAWELSDSITCQTIELMSAPIYEEDDQSGNLKVKKAKKIKNPFVITANAAESEDVKWANEIQNHVKYSSKPVQAISQIYNVENKKALKMLQMSADILNGQVHIEDEKAIEECLTVVKTYKAASKVGMFAIGTYYLIPTVGAMSLAGQGLSGVTLCINGADATVSVTESAMRLFAEEGGYDADGLEKAVEITEKINCIFSTANLFTGGIQGIAKAIKTPKKLKDSEWAEVISTTSFIADNIIRESIQEKTMLAGLIDFNSDGSKTVSFQNKSGGKTVEEVAKDMLNESKKNGKKLSELLKKMEKEKRLTKDEYDEVFNALKKIVAEDRNEDNNSDKPAQSGKGYWKLTETHDNWDLNTKTVYDTAFYHDEVSGGNGSYTVINEVIGSSGCSEGHDSHDCHGERMASTFTYTVPKDRYAGGETVHMDLNASATTNGIVCYYFGASIGAQISSNEPGQRGFTFGGWDLKDSNGDYGVKTEMVGEYADHSTRKPIGSSRSVSGKMPDGNDAEKGDKAYITVASSGSAGFMVVYEYTWTVDK